MRWRDSSTSSHPPEPLPYVLELGVDQGGKPLLPFRAGDISGDRILITKSYENMFYRLLRIRRYDKGAGRGALLTGQPGIGESLLPGPHPVRQLTGTPVLQEKLSS